MTGTKRMLSVGRLIPYRGRPPDVITPSMATERVLIRKLADALPADFGGFCELWGVLGLWIRLEEANRAMAVHLLTMQDAHAALLSGYRVKP